MIWSLWYYAFLFTFYPIVVGRFFIYMFWCDPVKKHDRNRYLFILAHPDDESMFFGPFITRVLANGGGISIVVCTDGGKGGLPETRKKEMTRLCIDHNISVFFLAYPDGELENTKEIQEKISRIYDLTKSTKIVTFDSEGVSRHSDHKACYMIGKSVAETLGASIYMLKTLTMLQKYYYPITRIDEPNIGVMVVTFTESLKNRSRMFYHCSQINWYRFLYIVFSYYMDYNFFVYLKK